MGSLAGAVAGPLVSSAIGGLGGDAGSATDASVAGANQAAAINAQYIQKAIDSINSNSGDAKNFLSQYYGLGQDQVLPYNLAGLNAQDMYMDALGLGTNTSGAQTMYLKDLQNKDDAAKAKFDATGGVNGLEDLVKQAQGYAHQTGDATHNAWLNNMFSSAAASQDPTYIKQQLGYMKDNINSTTNSWGSGVDWDPAANDWASKLDSNIANTANQTYNPLITDDQRNLLSNIMQGKDMMTPQASGQKALSTFLQTPGYQLLFNNGGASMDPNATALQRFQTSPGYQFSLDQGVKARDASAASKGMLLSGNQQQDLTNFGAGLANQEFNNYQTNLQNTYTNWLANLSGTTGTGANIASGGRSAANSTGSNLANVSTNQGNQIAGLYENQGATAANAALAAANARASGYLTDAQNMNQLGGTLGNAVSDYFKSPRTTSYN